MYLPFFHHCTTKSSTLDEILYVLSDGIRTEINDLLAYTTKGKYVKRGSFMVTRLFHGFHSRKLIVGLNESLETIPQVVATDF